MKIDIFAHILPEGYMAALKKKVKLGPEFRPLRNRAVWDIDMRLRLMDRYPDVIQVLTVALPPLEALVKPTDAVELAKIANDELAEMLAKYPDKFIAAVACLPLNDMDAALEEVDRTITQLKFKGVQICTDINGEPLGLPKFRPLYEKMANYDLPI
jgi:predicted TIM-barrel fold metal-dependent hydrolase